jgi:pimeloyl-ACP methyl ester carboxylesterase
VALPLPELDGIEHRFADLGEARVHYAEAGEGDPVLLLHGWPQHHAMWAGVIAALRDRYRLIAPDLRGFGWSSAPGFGYDSDTFASDQIALMDALGIERAFVLGHDWGAFTAIVMGIRHPDRVRGVLAASTPHPWSRPSPRSAPQLLNSWYALAAAAPGLGPELFRHGGFVAHILRHGNVGEPFSPEQVRAYARSYRDPERARAASALYRHYLRAFADGLRGAWRSSELTVPTLLLFGERDRLITAELVRDPDDFARNAKRMTVELVPGHAHFLVDEAPEIVIDRVGSFFSDTTAKTRAG